MWKKDKKQIQRAEAKEETKRSKEEESTGVKKGTIRTPQVGYENYISFNRQKVKVRVEVSAFKGKFDL